jgi:hypothetical protein
MHLQIFIFYLDLHNAQKHGLEKPRLVCHRAAAKVKDLPWRKIFDGGDQLAMACTHTTMERKC